MMKRDTIIQILSFLGLKKPISWLHYNFKTFGLDKIEPRILRVLPHDPNSHTQGLTFYNDYLYESTGRVGLSRLRCLDPKDGTVQKDIKIEREWCEGIATLDDKLVQLTYTSERALVYDPNTLDPLDDHFMYTGEGWGLASSDNCYIMSNGSHELTFRNKHFSIISILPVTLNGRPLRYINDLECVEDKIYANVQFDTSIYEIDISSGNVLRVIDCRHIVAQSGRKNFYEMINGIAYSPATGTFYITGKHWLYLFEIHIPFQK